MLRLQIAGDALRQVHYVWPGEPLKKVASSLPVEVLAGQPIEGGVGEIIEILPAGERVSTAEQSERSPWDRGLSANWGQPRARFSAG